jgi:diguanylate cyclase (GGDEF)-like protein
MKIRVTRYFRKSLLARYTLVTVLLVLSIFLMGGWIYLKHLVEEQLVGDSFRAAQNIHHSSNAMQASLWQAEFALSEYLISPSDSLYDNTVENIEIVLAELKDLQSVNPEMLQDFRYKRLHDDLQLSTSQLRLDAEQLMKVRVDQNLLFPAMPIIAEKMFPANIQFFTAVNVVLEELNTQEHTLAAFVFRDLRLLWTRMISEFRVFMAFRTGTFGMPDVGMPIYSRNVETLHEGVLDKLREAESLKHHEDIGFQVSDSYDEMQEAAQLWLSGYELVREIQLSTGWRMDIPLLEKDVRPMLVHIQVSLAELDQLAEDLHQASVHRFEINADRIDRNLGFIALMVLVVMVSGFIYLRRSVLQPIAQISKALNAEARGEDTDSNVSYGDASEINDLSCAFRTMHQQVRTREKELAFMAHHDALTQLPNRVLFRKHLEEHINRLAVGKNKLAVILIGIDRFKEINDTYGYKAGDAVLCEIGRILQEDYGPAEAIARLAGDEFALAINGVDEAQARHIATNLHTLFSRVFHSGRHSLRVSASMGIALYPDHSDQVDSLISRASIALQQAKHDHSIIAMYSRDRDPGSRARIRIIDTLRHALENDRLQVEYQPQVSTQSGAVVGFEALTRAPEIIKQGINVQQLIEIAEQTGLIHPLTEWLLSSVLRQCNEWQGKYHDLQMGINLWTTSFHNPDLVNMIQGGLSAWNMRGDHLKLEITEGVMMNDPKRAERVLYELNDLDIKISIDDFGTGYSSLQYLRSLPVHELKIDRSFVKSINTDKKDRSIVQTVIDFARNLEMHVVAEGVEDKETYDRLKAMGCDVVQGFYISRAMSADGIKKWMGAGRWHAKEKEVDGSMLR